MLSQKEKSSWQLKSEQKIIQPKHLKEKVQELKNKGLRIGTINGSFDLLHAGHLHILYEAALQADVCIVALNSDASIQKYKKKTRPIISLKYRLQMICALEFVDYVTWFDETTPCCLLEIIKPFVHTNGSEYGAQCIEANTVLSNGGKIHIVELIDGLSTSNIIKKIQTCD